MDIIMKKQINMDRLNTPLPAGTNPEPMPPASNKKGTLMTSKRLLSALAALTLLALPVLAAEVPMDLTAVAATAVTASSYYSEGGLNENLPMHASDWSGMTGDFPNGLASTVWYKSWAAADISNTSAEWIEWDLGGTYTLTKVHVWNYNEGGYTDQGIKKLDIQKWTGTAWENAYTGLTWALAPDSEGYAGFDQLFSTPITTSKIRFTNFESHGSDYGVGLGEVVFYYATAGPIAIAGGPYVVRLGGSLSLNGTNSLPSAGASITNYSWDLNNDGTFGDVTGATPAAISYATLTNTYGMVLGTNTVMLRVTDSSTQTDTNSATVTIKEASSACDILAFNANLAGSSATITAGATTGTVVVHVPPGTTEAQVVALAPSYTLSPFATCPQPNPGVPSPALSLTAPVHYIVTAENGSTSKDYTVTVTQAQGLTMALTGDSTSTYYGVWGNELDGYKFTVGDADIAVSWLGWFDAPNPVDEGAVGDGLMGDIEIGLWETSTWTLLASTTISAGTGDLIGSFRGQDITTPVTLQKNTSYTIAGHGTGGDKRHSVANLNGYGINGITMDGGVYGDWPNMPTSAWSFLIGPNFGYAAPPPTTIIGYGPWSSGSFPLTFSGPSNQTYQVLMSTNVALPLTSWTVLTNGTFGSDPVIFMDTGATNATQFYRIQSP